MSTPHTYEVLNRSTGKAYTYTSLKAAIRAADRMDTAYGAKICSRRLVTEAV